MYSIALIIYMYSVAPVTGFIKWMILHITDSMKILTSEKGSPEDLQGRFVIISVILCSLISKVHKEEPLIKILLQCTFI